MSDVSCMHPTCRAGRRQGCMIKAELVRIPAGQAASEMSQTREGEK